MDLLSAHAHFAMMSEPDRPELVCELTHTDPEMARLMWSVCAVALVSLSGMIDDCETMDDLIEAVSHGESLLVAGVITLDDVREEGADVVEQIERWAAAQAIPRN